MIEKTKVHTVSAYIFFLSRRSKPFLNIIHNLVLSKEALDIRMGTEWYRDGLPALNWLPAVLQKSSVQI
jgi:hypothetical protein